MEISQLIHLLAECINKKSDEIDSLNRAHAVQKSGLDNDLKKLEEVITKYKSEKVNGI